MKKASSIILSVLMFASCILFLASCKQQDGSLENVNALLMNDPELNEVFSSINVEVSKGRCFNAMLVFKDVQSQKVKEMSSDEGCKLSKMVHDKIKEAVLDAGYTKIVWIEAMMYSSNWKDVDNDYILSFGVGAANKTRVKVWADAFNPIWTETVSWGGFDELG